MILRSNQKVKVINYSILNDFGKLLTLISYLALMHCESSVVFKVDVKKLMKLKEKEKTNLSLKSNSLISKSIQTKKEKRKFIIKFSLLLEFKGEGCD